MNYFITGLPRSRTCWLATLFTYGNSYCFHELSNSEGDFLKIREKLNTRIEEFKGISDCLLPYYYEPLANTVEHHKLVIIDRPLDECIESLKSWIFEDDFDMKKLIETMKDLYNRIEEMKERYECLVVPFNALDKMEVVEQLWYYCVPNAKFDEERYETLNKFKIEPFYDKYILDLNEENVKSILGV